MRSESRGYHSDVAAHRDSARTLSYRGGSVTHSYLVTLTSIVAIAMGSPAQAADAAAVARPVLSEYPAAQRDGIVFFVKTERAGEVAAIGTAHTLKLRDVAKAGRVEFTLGNSRATVSASTAFLVPPGDPFNTPGGTLGGDFFVYALESAPRGIRTLELATERMLADLTTGSEVRILGISAAGDAGEIELRGEVRKASHTRIEVVLEKNVDLRGWGGAPVVSAKTDRVIGILQGAVPQSASPRVTVGPIAALQRALRELESGGTAGAFANFDRRLDPPPTTAAPSQQIARSEQRPVILLAPDRTDVHLEIEFPADGAVVSNSSCGAFVAGRAMALSDQAKQFDVALVLDTSGSTAAPTGADINGNGRIGTLRRGRISSFYGGSTDDGDSILAAEVAAARQILRDFDPRTTRAAVSTFAGGARGKDSGPPALTRQPLTNEYARVEQALDFILRTEPVGNTHISGAVDHTTTELLGLFGSRSEKNPLAEKLVFFFTDGWPTLPFAEDAVADNTRAVRQAAMRAHKAGLRVHSFAIGPEALAGPIASVELADLTGGTFIPVRHPGELSAVVEAISFANLEDVMLRSATTGDSAHPFRVTADGSWGGFLKMVPGVNVIEISARSTDGAHATETLQVVHEPAAKPNPIPSDLGVRHNRLLEDCLRDLKQVRVATEREHGEKVRKELLLEIGRERAKARQRAAEQRKQLKLEVEEPDASPR